HRRIKRFGFVRWAPVLAAVLCTAAKASAQAAPVADHDLWIGHLGVGWFGSRDVPVGSVAAPVSTPVVGVRYWATPMIGIDAGVGLSLHSGSTTNGAVTNDIPSANTFLLHGGVPIALAESNHFSFQVTPELDVGFGSGSNGPQDLSGFLLQVGG